MVPGGRPETDLIPVQDDQLVITHEDVLGVHVAVAHHWLHGASELLPVRHRVQGTTKHSDVRSAHDTGFLGSHEQLVHLQPARVPAPRQRRHLGEVSWFEPVEPADRPTEPAIVDLAVTLDVVPDRHGHS
jgi:hypothetical protein